MVGYGGRTATGEDALLLILPTLLLLLVRAYWWREIGGTVRGEGKEFYKRNCAREKQRERERMVRERYFSIAEVALVR